MSAAHVHLLLTHVPVMAALFGLVILSYALLRNRDALTHVGYGFFVLAMVSAIGVYLTGEAAEEVIEGMAGVSEAIIERNEDFAVYALAGAVVLGLLAAGALLMRNRGVPRGYAMTVLAVALVVNGLLAWTASLGG